MAIFFILSLKKKLARPLACTIWEISIATKKIGHNYKKSQNDIIFKMQEVFKILMKHPKMMKV